MNHHTLSLLVHSSCPLLLFLFGIYFPSTPIFRYQEILTTTPCPARPPSPIILSLLHLSTHP